MFNHVAKPAADYGAQLVVDPSFEMLRQVEHWLREEYENFYSGFYCNWDILQERFNNGQLFIFAVGAKCVGFICWYGSSRVKFVDIVEVIPSMRRRGVGRLMIEESLVVFGNCGTTVISLESPFFTSLPFWRSLNFIPNCAMLSCVNQRMYRVLAPTTRQSSVVRTSGYQVELWDRTPEEATSDAKWRWNIQPEGGNPILKSPIVFPANPSWRIRIRVGEATLSDGSVSSFGRPSIFIHGFIIIDRLDIETVEFC